MARRILTALLVAVALTVTSLQSASATPWRTWRDRYEIKHHLITAYPSDGQDRTPAMIEWVHTKIIANRIAYRAYLAAKATYRREHAPPPVTPPVHSVLPSPPPGGGGSVVQLIQNDFGRLGLSVGLALCIAGIESHYEPGAYNPYSGAAGVFQFVPRTWGNVSRLAGYGGSSPFSATANIGTAAWTARHVGWSPWAGDLPKCGA